MYVCFIDLSKVMVRVDHLMVFENPTLGINILCHWPLSVYNSTGTSPFSVRWASCLSDHEPFCVSNGVWQGGILSPAFFSVFGDDLSVCLWSVSVGCYMGETCMNHVIYADDTTLLAPSPTARQNLIDITAGFIKRELVVNMKKTKRMVIKPKCDNVLHVPILILMHLDLSRCPLLPQKFATSCITDCKGSDTTWELRMILMERQLKQQVKRVTLEWTLVMILRMTALIAEIACEIYARNNMLNTIFGNCTEEVKKQKNSQGGQGGHLTLHPPPAHPLKWPNSTCSQDYPRVIIKGPKIWPIWPSPQEVWLWA